MAAARSIWRLPHFSRFEVSSICLPKPDARLYAFIGPWPLGGMIFGRPH